MINVIGPALNVFEARFKSVKEGDRASRDFEGGKYVTVTVGGPHIEGDEPHPGKDTLEAAAEAWLTAAIAQAGDDDALWWRTKPEFFLLADGSIQVHSRFTTSKLQAPYSAS